MSTEAATPAQPKKKLRAGRGRKKSQGIEANLKTANDTIAEAKGAKSHADKRKLLNKARRALRSSLNDVIKEIREVRKAQTGVESPADRNELRERRKAARAARRKARAEREKAKEAGTAPAPSSPAPKQ